MNYYDYYKQLYAVLIFRGFSPDVADKIADKHAEEMSVDDAQKVLQEAMKGAKVVGWEDDK